MKLPIRQIFGLVLNLFQGNQFDKNKKLKMKMKMKNGVKSKHSKI